MCQALGFCLCCRDVQWAVLKVIIDVFFHSVMNVQFTVFVLSAIAANVSMSG